MDGGGIHFFSPANGLRARAVFSRAQARKRLTLDFILFPLARRERFKERQDQIYFSRTGGGAALHRRDVPGLGLAAREEPAGVAARLSAARQDCGFGAGSRLRRCSLLGERRERAGPPGERGRGFEAEPVPACRHRGSVTVKVCPDPSDDRAMREATAGCRAVADEFRESPSSSRSVPSQDSLWVKHDSSVPRALLLGSLNRGGSSPLEVPRDLRAKSRANTPEPGLNRLITPPAVWEFTGANGGSPSSSVLNGSRVRLNPAARFRVALLERRRAGGARLCL